MDIIDEITRTHREVRDTGEAKVVELTRHYDTGLEDLWDACTSAERISRWFLPITGDLRLGGSYQLKGNAGGEVLSCEPPNRFRVSWVMGEAPASYVEVRLAADGDRTRFELRHEAVVPPEFWEQFGPGSVGVGWDLGLLGLALHLTGGEKVDEEHFHETDEGREFIVRSSGSWGEAFRASGASPELAAAVTAATTAFYAPPAE
ncbi:MULTISPECIES: SRPBCC domain-containing protein [Nonomuraea]|uniref:SRPBCC domain-containing protein n=2 Tax=Nonomuraea TaxID=83681 RepID=A0ABW1C146_9ACTN|nr:MULTISPECIES: SRPBCC domain-containing protein [Nonomuraea]MDA0645989.1 SRPBCC domain-containing protein [Nonomuraea ferruginea]TXK40787.1 polyketide cyclase [Nonomuraea sp. C10]